MASKPYTIILRTKDRSVINPSSLLSLATYLFTFGVNEIRRVGDKVIVNLNYIPRQTTLIKKFGNLPIHYEKRTAIGNVQEIDFIDKLYKSYKFNLNEQEATAAGFLKMSASTSTNSQPMELKKIKPVSISHQPEELLDKEEDFGPESQLFPTENELEELNEEIPSAIKRSKK